MADHVKIQAENMDLKDSLNALRKEFDALQEENRQLAREKRHAEDVVEAVKKEGETNKRNISEVFALRKKITDLEKREKTMQDVIDELNVTVEELQLAMPSTPAASTVFEGGVSKEELQKQLDAVREEVEQKAEEEMYAMTIELEETIESQKTEIEALKRKAEELSAAATPGKAKLATGNDIDRALAEKAIAIRVKDGALAESGQLRAELEKTKVTIEDLRSQTKVLETQLEEARKNGGGGAGSSATHSDPMSGLADDDLKLLRAQMHEKEKLVAYLQDRVAELEVRVKSAEGEKDAAMEMKSMDAVHLEEQVRDLNEQLDRLAVEHQGDLDRLKVDYQIVVAERDKALAAGRRAFLERNTALSAAEAAKKKEQMLAKMSRRTSAFATSDAAKAAGASPGGTLPRELSEIAEAPIDDSQVKTVVTQVERTYDEMVDKIEKAETADERRDVMMDQIFDYEHKIWNLQNDMQSLSAIRLIREEELLKKANNEWAVKCEEYMSAIEILRMQIRELDKEPMC